jgi:hypothetical protein
MRGAMKQIWVWLKDDKNRDLFKMTTAGLTAVVAAAWAVLTFFVDHHPPADVISGQGGYTISAPGGVAAASITASPITINLSQPPQKP